MKWRLVVVVLVVLSGCSTPFGGMETATPTVTPAEVPDGPADSLAPGVEGQGVVAPALLVDAHNRTLANQSFTVRFTQTRLHYGELRDRLTIVGAIDPTRNVSRIRVRQPGGGAGPSVMTFVRVNDTLTRVVRVDNETVSRETFPPQSTPPSTFDPRLSDRFRRMLDSVAIDRIEPRDPDASRYVLSGSTPANRSLLVGARDSLQSVRLTVEITDSGRLQRYSRTHSFVRGRTNVTLLERGSIGAVGQTQVNTTLPE